MFMITDDQDELLGGGVQGGNAGGDPMRQTRARIGAAGATGTEWRIHTPICAPSRSELQTGKYYHNVKNDLTTPSLSVTGGAVGHVDLGEKVRRRTVPPSS